MSKTPKYFLNKAKRLLIAHINYIKKGKYNEVKYSGYTDDYDLKYIIASMTTLQRRIKNAWKFTTLIDLCRYIPEGNDLKWKVSDILFQYKLVMYRRKGMFKSEVETYLAYR
jgi:hypothetical protein